MAAVLVFLYLSARHAGNTDEMLFVKDYLWFRSLNIHYAVGVDGISVAMIALTSLVVFAGIFASWEVDFLQRNSLFHLFCWQQGYLDFLFQSIFLQCSFFMNLPLSRCIFNRNMGKRTERIFSHETDSDADGRFSTASCWVTWDLF